MIRRRRRLLPALVAAGTAVTFAFAGIASAANPPGFKTAKPAYLVPMVPGAAVDPILSTGDVVGGYQMSGIPDGLGAFNGGGDTLQVFMNHELGITFPGVPPGVDTRITDLTSVGRHTASLPASTASPARRASSASARRRSRRSTARLTT